jgi:hypothetical protein
MNAWQPSDSTIASGAMAVVRPNHWREYIGPASHNFALSTGLRGLIVSNLLISIQS